MSFRSCQLCCSAWERAGKGNSGINNKGSKQELIPGAHLSARGMDFILKEAMEGF